MPQKDGTGPQGKGPRTGRAMGTCSSKKENVQKQNEQPSQSPRDGRGAGKGCSRGYRVRNNF
ncbi:MAG: hypothetical protein CR972_03785 [Candidatus Moraniibacteriota bacterium]|nr:MAG: hypothetical protein CR972_03785 [Candidatus Moranbacteria bacterium]